MGQKLGQKLGPVQPLDGIPGVYQFGDGALRCSAVELVGGDLCLFNPVQGLSVATVDELQALGRVKYLLSPNHYHHKALQEYADQFPTASICASRAASPRLHEQTKIKAKTLAGLKKKLPKQVSVIETQGLKTGEIWLRVATNKEVCWLVGDAFCGSAQTKTKTKSFSAQPELLKPFPNYGVGSREQYLAWVTAQIETDQPTTVIPCHGSAIRSNQLPQKLVRLVSKGL